VDSGEMPIELGASWFSAKAIKVARFLNVLSVRQLNHFLTKFQTYNDKIEVK